MTWISKFSTCGLFLCPWSTLQLSGRNNANGDILFAGRKSRFSTADQKNEKFIPNFVLASKRLLFIKVVRHSHQ